MKRRKFGLLAGTSAVASAAALKLGTEPAIAQTAKDASQLTTTLTPFGAERAGNADGSIPAWTGGYTTVPAGWVANVDYYPDFFADDPVVVTIDSSNMAAHADKLSEGTMAMMTKYGFSIKVYQTRRTAAAPQGVYDWTAKNVATASLVSQGGRYGFQNAFGGIPFPILDTDPMAAGAQAVWNNLCRWHGYATWLRNTGYVVSSGSITIALDTKINYDYPYFNQSPETFGGILYREMANPYYGPPTLVGNALTLIQYTVPYYHEQQTWQLLNGQGRVRKTPEVSFDTPSSFANGVINYDEYSGFAGSPDKYNYRLVGKKEIYVPYNNNGLFLRPGPPTHLQHFLDPQYVRWELHRCWVIEATLAPGERNVLARRMFYLDEDTWVTAVTDAWDANNNLWKVGHIFNCVCPNVPGTVYANNVVYNLLDGNYASVSGNWDVANTKPVWSFFPSLPVSMFDPSNMAASSQY